MSEENDKNPLEVFLEKMEELLTLQVEQNKKLQSTINEYQTLMSKIGQERLIDQEEFKKLSEKLPQEILSVHKQSLSVMHNQSNRVERNVKSLDMQLYNAIEKATKSVSGIELSLNEKDRLSLKDTEIQIKRFKSNFYFLIGITAICLITTCISIYGATSFYKSSVLSKEEMRQNVLDDIQASQQEIYSTSYFRALENERQIIEVWKNANPNDSKSYLEFRHNYLEKYQTRNQPYFKSLDSDETNDGYGVKFKKGIFD